MNLFIPANVSMIYSSAFYDCKNLKSVTFSQDSKLRKIDNVFELANIASIKIPSRAEEIEKLAFYGCNSLESITFSKDSKLRIIGIESFFQNND